MQQSISLAIVLAACLFAVGSAAPPPSDDDSGHTPVNFQITNEYAEALFTLDYSLRPEDGTDLDVSEGEPTGRVFDEVRLNGYESEAANEVFSVAPGTRVDVELVVRTLGEDNVFNEFSDPDDDQPGLVIPNSFAADLLFVFEYDLANAVFSVGYGVR